MFDAESAVFTCFSLRAPAAVNGVASALMTPEKPQIVGKSFIFFIFKLRGGVFFIFITLRQVKSVSKALLRQTVDIMVWPVSPNTAGSNQH